MYMSVLLFGFALPTPAFAALAASEAALVEPTPWRSADDIIGGWDWSLPPGVRPNPHAYLLCRANEHRLFPGKKMFQWNVRWREIEPEEGKYDFEPIKETLRRLPDGFDAYLISVYGTVAKTKRFDGQGGMEPCAPDWLIEKYDLPLIDMGDMEGRFQLWNAPIWDERFHRHYLKMVEAFGRAGIAQMPEVQAIYLHAISKSWGEELYIPPDVEAWCQANAGLTPERLERTLIERLEAWAKACAGAERKLLWNDSPAVIQRAFELGMGQRNGFVEVYLTHVENPWLGQSLDPEGYLTVDESLAPIAENRAWGDENEEYGPAWTGRFGPIETQPYRYREATLRALQMRRNILMLSAFSVDQDPELTAYASLALGRNVEDTPDAWCYLRESYVKDPARGGAPKPVKNFERWLYQRDRDGARTTPVDRVEQHPKMYPAPESHRFDYTARQTDRAAGQDRIGFALDDRFLAGGPHRVAIKVTFRDRANARWALAWRTPQGEALRETQCGDSGEHRTATFFLDDAVFDARGMDCDFEIRALDGDAAISFVRAIKLPA